jgi:hypothetical protein
LVAKHITTKGNVNCRKLRRSAAFRDFTLSTAQLQLVDPIEQLETEDDKMLFFVRIFHILSLHAFRMSSA